MRISDWSSDVCSSDLGVDGEPDGKVQDYADHRRGDRRQRRRKRRVAAQQLDEGRTGEDPEEAGDKGYPGGQDCAEDRKSVVSGKSVSVRVDLGGCSIITKRNENKKKEYRTR